MQDKTAPKYRMTSLPSKPGASVDKKQDDDARKPITKSDSYVKQIDEKIRLARNILVTLSRDPSVDEMSAAIGLTLFLNDILKHTTAIYSGKTPDALEFLKPEGTFETNTDSLQDFIIALSKDKADHLHYSLDGDFVKVYITPYKTRITEDDLQFSYGDFNVDLVLALNVPTAGDLDEALAEHGRIMHDATTVNISRGKPGKFGEIEWSDAGASSVSEMVTRLIMGLNGEDKPLDSDVATALLTGIVAATGRFSNNQTSSSTLELASKLMTSGADQQLISANVVDNIVGTGMALPAEEEKPKRKKRAAKGTTVPSEPILPEVVADEVPVKRVVKKPEVTKPKVEQLRVADPVAVVKEKVEPEKVAEEPARSEIAVTPVVTAETVATPTVAPVPAPVSTPMPQPVQNMQDQALQEMATTRMEPRETPIEIPQRMSAQERAIEERFAVPDEELYLPKVERSEAINPNTYYPQQNPENYDAPPVASAVGRDYGAMLEQALSEPGPMQMQNPYNSYYDNYYVAQDQARIQNGYYDQNMSASQVQAMPYNPYGYDNYGGAQVQSAQGMMNQGFSGQMPAPGYGGQVGTGYQNASGQASADANAALSAFLASNGALGASEAMMGGGQPQVSMTSTPAPQAPVVQPVAQQPQGNLAAKQAPVLPDSDDSAGQFQIPNAYPVGEVSTELPPTMPRDMAAQMKQAVPVQKVDLPPAPAPMSPGVMPPVANNPVMKPGFNPAAQMAPKVNEETSDAGSFRIPGM